MDRLVLGRASGVGNLAVLLGSRTGRDGIGGVSVLASAGFSDDAEAEEAKRPNVQVGDPFEEKRLIEACLELLDERLVVGIQDLGGAGLTCATSETASRGGVGMDVNVAAVPRREPGMEAVGGDDQREPGADAGHRHPRDLDRVLGVCGRWEVRATVVGRVTGAGRLRILDGWDGEVLADVAAVHPPRGRPALPPAAGPPRRPRRPAGRRPGLPPGARDCGADLLALLVDPSWVYRQYDHQLFLNTVVAPGGDAALLRLTAPGVPAARPVQPHRAIALSTDGNGRWCALDPRPGTALVVAESALNVACVGARPVALVNCLNFGNPEHPEVMWQLSEAIDGMAEACRALGIPVIGGNVSLYNESRGRDIDPTPVVGTLGLVDRLERPPPGVGLVEGSHGAPRRRGRTRTLSLGGSRWAVGPSRPPGRVLPPLDLAGHARLLALVSDLVAGGVCDGVHDVSEGGLGVALAEMAVAGGVGFVVGGVRRSPGALRRGPVRSW